MSSTSELVPDGCCLVSIKIMLNKETLLHKSKEGNKDEMYQVTLIHILNKSILATSLQFNEEGSLVRNL